MKQTKSVNDLMVVTDKITIGLVPSQRVMVTKKSIIAQTVLATPHSLYKSLETPIRKNISKDLSVVVTKHSTVGYLTYSVSFKPLTNLVKVSNQAKALAMATARQLKASAMLEDAQLLIDFTK